MSLGIAIKGPEGIVLAADSRVTLTAAQPGMGPIPITFDNVTKLLTFSAHPYVGAVTYGQAVIGLRTAHSYVPEFEVELRKKGSSRLSVSEFASRLSEFYLARWKEGTPPNYEGPPMTFIVGGYDEGSPYGKVFLLHIPVEPKPAEQNPGQEFGMSWGGQLQIASRIIHGFDPILQEIVNKGPFLPDDKKQPFLAEISKLQWQIPWQILPLQDCVDLAANLISITKFMQDVGITIRGVGGITEIATITRTRDLTFVQRKRLHGEYSDGVDTNPIEGGR